MAIEAPTSKFRRNNFKIYISVCVVFALAFAYDGYLSGYSWSHRRSFYDKHVKQGKADDTMLFNRIAPIILIVGAVVLSIRLRSFRDKRLLADDNELIISERERISYDSIQKIDKTNFDSRGYFIITYKGKAGGEVNCKLSDKMYDNLSPVLEHLVAKITENISHKGAKSRR